MVAVGSGGAGGGVAGAWTEAVGRAAWESGGGVAGALTGA